MQKTQAGQSCPFGPRTIPGGQSGSFSVFGSDEEGDEGGLFSPPGDVFGEERSTGRLLLLRLPLRLLATDSEGDGGLAGTPGSGSLLTTRGWKAEWRRSLAAAAAAMLCSSRSRCPNDGFRMLSMEKGRADRSAAAFLLGPTAVGRKGWKRSGGGTPREGGGGGGVGSGECSAEWADGDKEFQRWGSRAR